MPWLGLHQHTSCSQMTYTSIVFQLWHTCQHTLQSESLRHDADREFKCFVRCMLLRSALAHKRRQLCRFDCFHGTGTKRQGLFMNLSHAPLRDTLGVAYLNLSKDEHLSTCPELCAVRGASSSQMCYVLPAQRQRPLAVFLVNNSGGCKKHYAMHSSRAHVKSPLGLSHV